MGKNDDSSVILISGGLSKLQAASTKAQGVSWNRKQRKGHILQILKLDRLVGQMLNSGLGGGQVKSG
jgi:hypothetical protein